MSDGSDSGAATLPDRAQCEARRESGLLPPQSKSKSQKGIDGSTHVEFLSESSGTPAPAFPQAFMTRGVRRSKMSRTGIEPARLNQTQTDPRVARFALTPGYFLPRLGRADSSPAGEQFETSGR